MTSEQPLHFLCRSSIEPGFRSFDSFDSGLCSAAVGGGAAKVGGGGGGAVAANTLPIGLTMSGGSGD